MTTGPVLVTTPPNTAELAISYALAQQGKPYRWGATGPDAFDCSGLIYAAFQHAGLTIPRVTYSQITGGQAVNPKDIAPGDLLFPEPGHVWLYLGNNKAVEAPHTGDHVKVITIGPFMAARRYTAPAPHPVVPINPGAYDNPLFDKGYQVAPADPLAPVKELARILAFFANPHNYVRIGLVILGGALLLFALTRLEGAL